MTQKLTQWNSLFHEGICQKQPVALPDILPAKVERRAEANNKLFKNLQQKAGPGYGQHVGKIEFSCGTNESIIW